MMSTIVDSYIFKRRVFLYLWFQYFYFVLFFNVLLWIQWRQTLPSNSGQANERPASLRAFRFRRAKHSELWKRDKFKERKKQNKTQIMMEISCRCACASTCSAASLLMASASCSCSSSSPLVWGLACSSSEPALGDVAAGHKQEKDVLHAGRNMALACSATGNKKPQKSIDRDEICGRTLKLASVCERKKKKTASVHRRDGLDTEEDGERLFGTDWIRLSHAETR